MTERIAFIGSQTNLPIEIEGKCKPGSRNQKPAKQVLNLALYLENLEVVGENAIAFTLRRLSDLDGKTTQGNARRFDSTSDEHADIQSKSPDGFPADGLRQWSDARLVSIRPSWVLDLIEPSLKWSLTRTAIDLDMQTGALPVTPATASGKIGVKS
jgi:hypothetical protein